MSFTRGGILTSAAAVACLCASLFGAPCAFIRGDATGDRIVDAKDAAAIARHVLGSAENPWRFCPSCLDAADVDDDGEVAVRDVCVLMDFLMRGGPMPAPPFPGRGLDTTPDCLHNTDSQGHE